jgi:L-lactate dehydrogenase
VIGCGHVGSTLLHVLYAQGVADEIVVYDVKAAKAAADVLDLQDSAALLPGYTKLVLGGPAELAACDIVVSALGHIHLVKPDGDRFTELRVNAPAVLDLGGRLRQEGFAGVLLVITNPVDVITGLYQQATGLPKSRVLGTGTYLDSARLRRAIGARLGLDPRSVSGYQLGEHGESQFTAWSTARALGRPVSQVAAESGVSLAEIEDDARQGGFTVLGGKGYTNYAIATAAASLVSRILADAHCEAVCSHWHDEFGGYLSSPAVIGRDGVLEPIALPLTAEERMKLSASAESIRVKTEEFSAPAPTAP